ncbi:hypothetical protein P4B35_23285 [Pontiellaceae bacterium B12227]|nr:hypothetical protein [Pontiellaceae bacterium B12227]
MYDDEYNELPARPRRRISLRWVLLTAALSVFLAYRVTSDLKRPQIASQEVKIETVNVVDWKAVDVSVQRCLEHAHDKAERYAEGEVQVWVKTLRTRLDEDFLPWWFSYFNQQAVMLKAAGYWCLDTPLIEGVLGKQESMEDRLEDLVEREFHARVLQPKSAQLRIEKITRKTIEVYLLAVQEELNRVQVEFQVHQQDWDRYLAGLPVTVMTLEANRQVGLVMKGVSAGGGVAALGIGRSLTGRVRSLVVHRVNQEFLEHGAMVGGRVIAKNAGWWIAAGCFAWDLADHHRTVAQNRPVLRRSLGTFLDELQEQVLRDQRCGVLTVLAEVQRDVIGELEVDHEP